MNHTQQSSSSVYFASVLPWQQQAWAHLIARYDRLPHGLLFAGMQGIGKRAFVWRFVGWLLCEHRDQNLSKPAEEQGGCGHCQSCQWLASGTHPDLQVLPASSLPVDADLQATESGQSKNSPSKSNSSKKTLKQTAKKNSKSTAQSPTTSIKVDDIRQLQPFISQGSSGRRVCVIDNADSMTVAAANALLKTLEEPREGIHILLISDMPARLLPTIKSRVQQVPVAPSIHAEQEASQVNQSIQAYLMDRVKAEALLEYTDDTDLAQKIHQALTLANGAPLAALDMLASSWYGYRQIWLNAWIALRAGRRSSVAASDYWQKTLDIDDFIKLSEFMLMDLSRQSLGMASLHQDLQFDPQIAQLSLQHIYTLLAEIDDIKLSCQQNVQPKMAYDHLMASVARL